MGTSSPETVSTKLQRIANLAREAPGMVLTTLAHHIDLEMLREAYRQTRKDGATGVDGQTAADYEKDLEINLRDLLGRFKSGRYRAPPVRRVYIPKDRGKTRPIGIPTFEDKVLQRAVAMILGAVYEQDFWDCSYGFRPGRSAHQGIETLWEGLMRMGGGWVLEVDIESFFDRLGRGHLRNFLDQRVRDGVLRRMIDKWLKAGVVHDGNIERPETGTPQGGVISPLLANIYLHEVLDRWFHEDVRPRLRGGAFLVRYADDAVMVFERRDDVDRVMKVLSRRLDRFGLTLHPEKTRIVEFRSPGWWRTSIRGECRRSSGTFDFLGFRHFWSKSRKGTWIVKRKTSPKRFSAALRRVSQWCRWNRHRSIKEQQQSLAQKLNGHYSYFGITGNGRALERFRLEVGRAWHRWLDRRSQRGMTWQRFTDLYNRYPLPKPRVVHSVYRT